MDGAADEPYAGRDDNAASAGSAAGSDRFVDRRLAIGVAVCRCIVRRNREVAVGEFGLPDSRQDAGNRVPTNRLFGRVGDGQRHRAGEEHDQNKRTDKKIAAVRVTANCRSLMFDSERHDIRP